MQNKSTPEGETQKKRQGRGKGRHNDKSQATRILLTINKQLLARVDEAAKQDYTSRSDIIRVALLWYLRPQGRDYDQVDMDEIFKTMKQRRMTAGVRKLLKNDAAGAADGAAD